jgi:hypothetical protein
MNDKDIGKGNFTIWDGKKWVQIGSPPPPKTFPMEWHRQEPTIDDILNKLNIEVKE